MTESLYKRLKNWLEIEKRSPPESVNKQDAEIDLSTPSLSEAFFELGRLRLENRRLQGDARSSRAWLERAKEEAGYNTNVSFDVVWKETLELANKWKEHERAEEQQTRDKAIK